MTLAALETKRKERNITQKDMCLSAGVDLRWYLRCLQNQNATADMYKRLNRALSRIAGKPEMFAKGARSVFIAYFPVCALVARDLRIDIELLHQHPPAQKATNNPDWLAAAQLREVSVYLLNTVLNIKQAEIAHALGVTPAAVCQICKKIEDKRDEPELGAIIDKIEMELAHDFV